MTSCCVCGNTAEDKFTILYKKPDYHVVECAVCSFQFIPAAFRKEISYDEYKNEKVAEQVRKGNNWIKIQRHLLRFKLIRKYKPSGKLLDFGSGWGHFLLTGKQVGYDVAGVEVAREMYLYSKNDLQLPVERIDFFQLDEQKKFDIISMWDVLEHIDHADKAIEKCKRIINKDGYLFIQVPQIDSMIAKAFKDNWKMMSLDHVNYFSKKTITQLLNAKGFDVIKIKSSVELKLFLLYTVLPFVRKVFPKRKKKSETTAPSAITSEERQEYFNKFTNIPKWALRIFIFFHNILYNTLSFFRIGEEMIIVAKSRD